MLLIFDLDGTLIESYMERPARDYAPVTVLPNRRERLAERLAEGDTIAIATNQAGVAFGFVTEADVERKLAAVLVALGLAADTTVAACYNHPKARIPRYRREDARRKPGGGMLEEIIAAHPDAASGGVLFVGDSAADKQAAEAAGVSFQWASDFFSS